MSVRIATFSFALVFPVFLFAQDRELTRAAADRFELIQEASVQAELEMSSSQKSHLQVILTNFSAPNRDRDFRIALSYRDVADRYDSAAKQVLDDKQMKRFRELALQLRGAEAFLEPDVIARLRLSEDQIDRVREATVKVVDARAAAAKAKGTTIETRKRREIETAKRVAIKKLATLLTDDQQAEWKTMIGAPFTPRRSR